MIEPHNGHHAGLFFHRCPGAQPSVASHAGSCGQPLVQPHLSVDTDTSTSDTVVVLANGQAGAVAPEALEQALTQAAVYLAREIARDGEGATKLIELTVNQAPSPAAALAIAKSVVNSPLVKTAIHGADPNWGRFGHGRGQGV